MNRFRTIAYLIKGTFLIDISGLLTPPLLSLILANLVPIFGVLFFGWEIYPVMVLFWTENVVIALITVIKISAFPSHKPSEWGKKFLYVPYFCFSYGLLFFLQGFAVFAIFGGDFKGVTLTTLYESLAKYQLIWSIFALFISHVISFYSDYCRKAQYRRTTLDNLIYEPYMRWGIMFIIVFAGGFFIKGLGTIIPLILLVTFKIYLDILAYQKYQTRVNNRAPVIVLPVKESAP